jgi:hypothetical protein
VKRARLLAFALGLAFLLPRVARAEPPRPLDPAGAAARIERATKDGELVFCKNPSEPLSPHANSMCDFAPRIGDCAGFVDACRPIEARQPPSWLFWLLSVIAAVVSKLAPIGVWVAVALLVLAIAYPTLRAIAKKRRQEEVKVEEATLAPNVATVVPDVVHDAPVDADALLARAEAHAARGELKEALFLYLAAALRALHLRGAIELERHKTNGEYVRACTEPGAKSPLREIVRVVDRVQFGGEAPTREGVREVATRAGALVKAAAATTALLAVLLMTGCGRADAKRLLGDVQDPGGNTLVYEALRGSGASVERLTFPVAALDRPGETARYDFALLVDVTTLPLDEEGWKHILGWTRAGGAIAVFGSPTTMPDDIGARGDFTEARAIHAEFPIEDDDSDDGDVDLGAETPPAAADGWVAHGFTFEPKDDTKFGVVARYPDHSTYAAWRALGLGRLVLVANADLLTNAGIAVPGNAAALATILRPLGTPNLRVLRAENLISAPGNPFIALLRIGLSLPLGHALVAVLFLFLAVGVPLAKPFAPRIPSRRAFAEHVQATGALYAKTNLAAHALARYFAFVDSKVRAKLPRNTGEPAAYLAARGGLDPATCARVWRRASEANPDAPRGDELVVLQELSALVATLDDAELRPRR